MTVNITARRLGDRPTIVALHASSSSGGQWAPLASYSAPHVDVVAADLHGHGLGPAAPSAGETIFARNIARVAALCDRIGGGIHLVGHSYGGATALRVALSMPDRVRSLTVYEPVLFSVLNERYGRGGPGAEVWEIARAVRQHVRAGMLETAARIFIDYWSGAGTWDSLAPSRQMGHAARMPVIGAQFASLAYDPVRLEQFRALEIPVLCIVGRDTRAPVTRIAELLAGTLPHATLERVPGLAHMGPVTHPVAFAERVVDFVRRVETLEPLVRKAA
jgi:pimeloyl-ACP methyl ester carboxylesterase